MQLLRERDMTAGELAEKFDFAKPTMSRHFSVLREADLIQGTKSGTTSGTTITYRLNVSVLEEAMLGMMETFKITLDAKGLSTQSIRRRRNKARDDGSIQNNFGG